MMPLDLILIRHGESEGNVAGALARQGDESHYNTDDFVTTPGREWQLTAIGQKQAQIVGQHLRETEFPTAYPQLREEETTRFYCSPYVRTRQTAGHLGLENSEGASVRWYLNRVLRERDWGDIETRPRREFEESPMFELNARKKAIDPLYWRPPGGESICDVAENRVRNFLDTLHRECSDQTVLAVTHGEFIRATRLVLERVDDETYTSWETNPEMRIRNCEIFHYLGRRPPPRRRSPADRLPAAQLPQAGGRRDHLDGQQPPLETDQLRQTHQRRPEEHPVITRSFEPDHAKGQPRGHLLHQRPALRAPQHHRLLRPALRRCR